MIDPSLNGLPAVAPASPARYAADAPFASWQEMQKRSSPFEQPVPVGLHATVAAPTRSSALPEVSWRQTAVPLCHACV